MKTSNLEIDCNNFPNVLLLGNGMLKLNDNGISWDKLIQRIGGTIENINYKAVPYAMQPEAVCGTDVEEIQRSIAREISFADETSSLLEEILELPFDAIITTNYTYEIEKVLSGGKWTSAMRKKAYLALDGNTKVNHNTHVCNLVTTSDGRRVPVFHIHGEYERKHSMILSYYSYANILSKLINYNKKLGNSIQEHQMEHSMLICRCWLDYFILGNVWTVGFGLDFSEFDVWWAIERKARENADHGNLMAFFDGEKDSETPQSVLLNSMKAEYQYIPVIAGDYSSVYQKIIHCIKNNI